MDRAITIGNRLCYDQGLKMAWRRHQEKMKGMRCRVETGRRQEMQAIAMVSKKDTLRDMRMEAIDRENSILLGKISAISYKTPQPKPQPHPPTKPTLHQQFRKRQKQKITDQNYQLFRRLTNKKSTYSVKQMLKQRKQVQKRINLISQFGYNDMKRSKTQVKLWMTNESFLNRDLEGEVWVSGKGGRREYRVSSRRVDGERDGIRIQAEGKSGSGGGSGNGKERYELVVKASRIRRLLKVRYNNYLEDLLRAVKVDRAQGRLEIVGLGGVAENQSFLEKEEGKQGNTSIKSISRDNKTSKSATVWKLDVQGCENGPYQKQGFKVYQKSFSLVR